MHILISSWGGKRRVILGNATSLFGTTVVTSGLGFVFWWVAARQFTPAAVGLATVAISSLSLLGSLGVLGLGTVLMGELPRRAGGRLELIVTALVISGAAGGALGVLFVFLAPMLSGELRPLRESVWSVLVFALATGFTALTLVLDQALVGLLRGDLQFWRNLLFSITKLGCLWLAAGLFGQEAGLAIVATWLLGILLSLAPLATLVLLRGDGLASFRPAWSFHGVGREALRHHVFNVTLQASSYVLPVMVTTLLSVTMAAYYTIAQMLASVAFMVPTAVTTALYAATAADVAELPHRVRFTLGLTFALGLIANAVIALGAGLLLSLLGPTYVEHATRPLQLFVLSVFPYIIREHYVAIRRIEGRTLAATLIVAAGGLGKLLAMGIGTSMGGLVGLGVGGLVASCVEAIFMVPTVYNVATGGRPPRQHKPN